jgi:hypothetical protein
MVPYNPNLDIYLQRPMKDNLPAQNVDPEYLLKPLAQKSLDPAMKDLIDMCVAKKLASLNGGGISFSEFYYLIQDPEVRSKISKLYARPLKALRQKLLDFRENKESVPWVTCLMPGAQLNSLLFEKPFWKEAADEIGGPVLDLYDSWTALRVSYYPLSELTGNDHYNSHGHELLAFLIAHQLIEHQWIPWGPPKPEH